MDVAGRLRRKRIWALLQMNPPDNPNGGVIRFVITCRHKEDDIHEAITALSHV
ncbi:MAG: hypothetical protein MRJ65_11900 [Candidatus Brocadiaceae bacterium]|nr:hypothetical protein [Candidatus Brocadiaceae bacterium]